MAALQVDASGMPLGHLQRLMRRRVSIVAVPMRRAAIENSRSEIDFKIQREAERGQEHTYNDTKWTVASNSDGTPRIQASIAVVADYPYHKNTLRDSPMKDCYGNGKR